MGACCAGCTLCALNEVEAAKQEFAAALAIMPRHLEVRCGSLRDKLVPPALTDHTPPPPFKRKLQFVKALP